MIEIVVFDMAGTTVDEQNLVYKTLHRSILDAGYEISFDTVLRMAAGKEKRQAIQDSLSTKLGEKEASEKSIEIFSRFRSKLLDAYHKEPIAPQPGAPEVFKALKAKGVKVVLNTGYDRTTADLLLRRLGWDDQILIDLVVTASEVENGRPHPDMILSAMEQLNCTSAERVIKIGDSKIDIEEGKRAGCLYNVGITTGAHTREQLNEATPTMIIDSLKELMVLFE